MVGAPGPAQATHCYFYQGRGNGREHTGISGPLAGGGVVSIKAPSCFFSLFSNFTFVSTSKPPPCSMSMLKSF